MTQPATAEKPASHSMTIISLVILGACEALEETGYVPAGFGQALVNMLQWGALGLAGVGRWRANRPLRVG